MPVDPDHKADTDQKTSQEAESRARVQQAGNFFELAEKGESPQANWLSAIQEYEAAEALASLKAVDYLNWGTAFVRLKNDTEAVEKYKKAIETDNHHARAHIYCGNALTRLKRYDEAAKAYGKAAEFPDADYAATFAGWGNTLYETNHPKDAVAKYLKVMELDPTKVDYVRWVGALAQIPEQERVKSIQTAEQSIGRDKDFADANVSWGNALLDLRRLDEATAKYREAISVRPELAPAFNGMGRVYLQKKRYSEAAAQFRKAADLNPLAAYYYNSGLALAYLKDYHEAAKQFGLAAQRDNDDATAYAKWGDALYETQDFAKARAKYLEAMQHDPTVVDYSKWVAVSDKAEDQHGATAEAERLIQRKPEFVEAYNSWGYALSEAGRSEESIEKYRKASELNPTNHNAYVNWGNALCDQGQYSGACSKYLKAMDYDPTTFEYSRWVLALDLLPSDERGDAIEKAEQAIARKPEFLGAYNSWGYSLSLVPKYKEALEKFDKVIKSATPLAASSRAMNSVLAVAYYYWAILLGFQQEYSQAFSKFQQSTDLDNGSVNPWISWAAGLVDQKRYAEAVAKCEIAQRIDPQYTYTYLIWGNALIGLGRCEEGIEKYQFATRIDSDFAYAYHNIADARTNQGNYKLAGKLWEVASEAYKRAKKTYKGNRDADFFWYYGATLRENLRDFTKAEEAYREGLAISPNHPGILIGLGTLRLAQRDDQTNARTSLQWEARNFYKSAEAAVRARFDQAPGNANDYFLLAQIYLQMESYDQAEKNFLLALELNREFPAVFNGLGVVYTKQEDFAKAVRYFTDALRFDPDNLRTRSNLAEGYLKVGLNYKALEEYTKILQVTPDHVESLIGLGQVFTNLGEDGDEDQLEEAVDYFNRALKKSKAGEGSKVLSKTEYGAVYYSLGYARIRLAQTRNTGPGSLQDALQDFRSALANDPEHQKARIAVGKLERRSKTSLPEQFWERWGSGILVFFTAFLFVFAQLRFYWKIPRGAADMGIEAYSLMSFGSLAFMVAGFYLPKILKLKVAGVELEKSAVDQVAVSGPVKISR